MRPRRPQADLDAVSRGVGDVLLEACAPREGEAVLDVGCGAGATSLALAQAVGSAKVLPCHTPRRGGLQGSTFVLPLRHASAGGITARRVGRCPVGATIIPRYAYLKPGKE